MRQLWHTSVSQASDAVEMCADATLVSDVRLLNPLAPAHQFCVQFIMI